jgi:DNA replication protein DnaC
MNNYQTIEKLRQLRLKAMAELHHQNIHQQQLGSFTADEYLALLIDHEWEDRQQKKLNRLLKAASFKQRATALEVDYLHHRNLDKNAFIRLCTLSFLQRKENVIITGPAGVGKSYLAQTLGNQACTQGLKVRYSGCARLLSELKLAKLDGTYPKELRKLQRTHLLILDDFGLQAIDNTAREILMDIVDDRYNEASTVLCSQIPVSAWHATIGEGTIADAILDRIVNSSHRIDLNGDSLRKLKLKTD